MNPWDGLLVSVADRPGLDCAPKKKRGAKRAMPTVPARLVPAGAILYSKSTDVLKLIPVVVADFYAERTEA